MRILIWFVAAGVFWIAGGLADGPARTVLWLVALAIDYGGAARSSTGSRACAGSTPTPWDVETSHFAERFQLFVIIALGESIVLTGATTTELELDAARLTAFALAFLATRGAVVAVLQLRRARSRSAGSSSPPNRTTLARDGYTYLHVVIVAGRDRRRGRRRAGDRPPDRGAAGRRGRGGRRRPGDLPARATCCSGCAWRARELEAARRRGRVRRRSARSAPRSALVAGGAAGRDARRRDRRRAGRVRAARARGEPARPLERSTPPS